MSNAVYHQNVFRSLPCSFCHRPLQLKSHVSLKLSRKFSTVRSSENLDLSKPLILSKYTRLEFEQKRWGISDQELQKFLITQGSDYDNLKYRHGKHYGILSKVEKSLRSLGSDVVVVHRQEFDEDLIAKSSVIISVGGDGTFLQAASKISGNEKPLIGVNSDTSKSLGFLCLPKAFTENIDEGLQNLIEGNYEWLYRKRIRLTIDCNGAIPSAISLSDEQMKFYNHLSDLRQSSISAAKRRKLSNKTVLPLRALNDVYIGEYVASGTSYFEMKVDEGPTSKHKSSGLIASTGTGSNAWFSSHSRLTNEQIRKVAEIASNYTTTSAYEREQLLALSDDVISQIGEQYLKETTELKPCSKQMLFSVKDPLHNHVFCNTSNETFTPSREWGKAETICVHSRLWDGCIILDGNWAYGFDHGAWVKLEILDEDALKTVQIHNC